MRWAGGLLEPLSGLLSREPGDPGDVPVGPPLVADSVRPAAQHEAVSPHGCFLIGTATSLEVLPRSADRPGSPPQGEPSFLHRAWGVCRATRPDRAGSSPTGLLAGGSQG